MSEIHNANFILPNGWRWVRLGEVCEKPQYGYTASADSNRVGPKFLRITDIQHGEVNWHAVPYCRCTDIDINKYPRGHFVCANRTGGTTGKSYLITQAPESIFASYLIRVKPSDNLLSEFLYLFLQSDIYWQQVEGSKRGGAQPNMNATLLANVTLPIPPLPEQKRIAAKIQNLIQEVERARTACEKQLEAAKALPSAYLRETFEGEEAKRWERKRLGEVISLIKNGIVAEQNFEGGGFNVTRIETISNGLIDQAKVGWVNKRAESFADFKLDKWDILFSHINSVERLGNCAIYEGIPENLYHGMNLLRIKVNENILDSYFLLYYLRSDYCRRYYITNARRAIGQASLNQKDIKQIAIILPHLYAQRRIVADLKEKMTQVEKLSIGIQNELEAITALPQAILRRALKGEL